MRDVGKLEWKSKLSSYLGCLWYVCKLISIKRRDHKVVNACERNSSSLGLHEFCKLRMSCKDKEVLPNIMFPYQDSHPMGRFTSIVWEVISLIHIIET